MGEPMKLFCIYDLTGNYLLCICADRFRMVDPDCGHFLIDGSVVASLDPRRFKVKESGGQPQYSFMAIGSLLTAATLKGEANER
jgi:hypothetical protein